MYRNIVDRVKRSDMIFANIDNALSSIYNKIVHNTSGTYEIDNITRVIEDILLNYLELEKDQRMELSVKLVNKYIVLFTKLLTMCNIETTGYLVEMEIPQLVISTYKSKKIAPQLPFNCSYTIPKVEDIIPDNESYMNEFIRCFTIIYKEYFYNNDPEEEVFAIPMFMAYHVSFVDKTVHSAVSDWFRRYLKGISKPLNNIDSYLIDCITEFIHEHILRNFDMNMTQTYIDFKNIVGSEIMPYYYEASLDSFWLLDQILRAVYDELTTHFETLLLGFYYNPLMIRLIIGVKMRMFKSYAKKVGRYYESII